MSTDAQLYFLSSYGTCSIKPPKSFQFQIKCFIHSSNVLEVFRCYTERRTHCSSKNPSYSTYRICTARHTPGLQWLRHADCNALLTIIQTWEIMDYLRHITNKLFRKILYRTSHLGMFWIKGVLPVKEFNFKYGCLPEACNFTTLRCLIVRR